MRFQYESERLLSRMAVGKLFRRLLEIRCQVDVCVLGTLDLPDRCSPLITAVVNFSHSGA